MPENMTKIKRDVYFVRTQAGYRKALKHFQREMDECDKEVRSYPKKYPSLVILSSEYNGGCHVTRCKSFHVNELKDIITLDDDARKELAKTKKVK